MNWNLLLLNCQPQKFKYYLWEFTDIHLWMLYTVFIYCASHSLPLPHPLCQGEVKQAGKTSYQTVKKKELDRTPIFKGGLLEKRGEPFKGWGGGGGGVSLILLI